jgi:hypothetical protein
MTILSNYCKFYKFIISLKSIALTLFFAFSFGGSFANNIVGSTYVLPNAESVYRLSDTSLRAKWQVVGAATFASTSLNTSSVVVKFKDTCFSVITLRTTLSSGRTISKSISIRDVAAPEFNSFLDTVFLPSNTIDTHKPTAKDDTGKPVKVDLKTWNYAKSNEQGTPQMLLTWEAVDFCGNKRTRQQVVNIIDRDTTPPMFLPFVECLNLPCDSVPRQFEAPKASDNTSSLVEVRMSSMYTVPFSFPSCATRTHTLVWTATDAHGNTTTAYQYVYIKDRQAPVFDSLPVIYLAKCNPNAIPDYKPKVKEGCSGPPIVYRISRRVQHHSPCALTVTDLWEAVDNCNNVSRAYQIIELKDTVPPVFRNVMTRCVPCNMIPTTIAPPMVSDECDANPRVYLGNLDEVRQILTKGCYSAPYNVDLFWVAVDRCGNEDYVYQQLQVRASCPMVGVMDIQRTEGVVPLAISNKDKNTLNSANESEEVFGSTVLNTTVRKNMPVSIYPNPSNGKIFININAPMSGTALLEFFDITGRQIGNSLQKEVSNAENVLFNHTFPSETPSGFIFYKITIGSHQANGKLQFIKN